MGCPANRGVMEWDFSFEFRQTSLLTNPKSRVCRQRIKLAAPSSEVRLNNHLCLSVSISGFIMRERRERERVVDMISKKVVLFWRLVQFIKSFILKTGLGCTAQGHWNDIISWNEKIRNAKITDSQNSWFAKERTCQQGRSFENVNCVNGTLFLKIGTRSFYLPMDGQSLSYRIVVFFAAFATKYCSDDGTWALHPTMNRSFVNLLPCIKEQKVGHRFLMLNWGLRSGNIAILPL